LRGTVEQSGSVDEESGGFAGVAYLAKQGWLGKDKNDYVIITEPTDNEPYLPWASRGVLVQGDDAWADRAWKHAHLGVSAIDQSGGFSARRDS